MKKIEVDYDTFAKLYQEESEKSGKYLISGITGYRALEIILEVFRSLDK